MNIRRTAAALTSAAALSVTGVAMATPASAAPGNNQAGLVNVGIVLDDVTIQVPIAVALNLCDVNVNVLGVIDESGQQVECDAFAESQADA